MSALVSDSERTTQDRVIRLLVDELGYDYLGDWQHREDNSNVDEELLAASLAQRGYDAAQIASAVHTLSQAARAPGESLYHANRAVYELLRYGVAVKTEAGANSETVQIVDWKHPERNHFAVAEEVTLSGGNTRRPDVVLYLNGIAVAVLELKNSRVSLESGIRQNISNQRPDFNAWFFSTVQLVLAGNDSEGLRYATVGTPEKFWMEWRENPDDNSRLRLDKYLSILADKTRLLELIRDFVLFDGGIKKVPRSHQYMGVKAAQNRIEERKGGVLWHTQGSGKSILMVLIARWILRTKPEARVLVVTDRDELDKQIESVFHSSGEQMHRTKQGSQLATWLKSPTPRLMCSLVHKFGPGTSAEDADAFLRELEANPEPAAGELFVFVDECHRTQSGTFHRAMKAYMPGATFIGFTGTPLLKEDKKTSEETFGRYIHTYTFRQGVDDGIVLDLVYEARDVDQRLASTDQIDAWFEAKTRGLNSWQRDELKTRWATMREVVGSHSRMERIKNDIVVDFSTKPRLASEKGNAILVAPSIYDACRYYKLFQQQNTGLRGKCAVITSYTPSASDVSLEDTGASTETQKELIYRTYTDLHAEHSARGLGAGVSYEDWAKQKFVREPATMKLLIVVDKLLTGFDAPACSYLYIDKSMQDHGLFQAICRVNRLDGPDKQVGHVVDYKDLFRKVENAISVYTSELDHEAGTGVDPEVTLQSRIQKARERLDASLEVLHLLTEPVDVPQTTHAFTSYFCGNPELPEDLEAHAPRREALYKSVAQLTRAYAAVSGDMAEAGYSAIEAARIKKSVEDYLDLRDVIRRASGEVLDLKPYEADMRFLIDTFVEADAARKVSDLGGMSLLEAVEKLGIREAIDRQPEALKSDPAAMNEAIENNVRASIVRKHMSDPAFFEKMSALLAELVAQRRAAAIAYAEYLERISELIKSVNRGTESDAPEVLKTRPALRALYNSLVQHQSASESKVAYNAESALDIATRLDESIRAQRPDEWRATSARQRAVQRAMNDVLDDPSEVMRLYPIVVAQDEY